MLFRSIVTIAFAPKSSAAQIEFDSRPINYTESDVHDPIAILSGRLSRNEAALKFDPQHGYLPDLLKKLKVPISSQTLPSGS